MKQNELQNCIGCGKGVLHSNQVCCTKLRVTRMVANVPAIRRQHGLEMMLGGNAAIAFHMGEQEDLLKPLGGERAVLVCDKCAMDKMGAVIDRLWSEEGANGTH